jgi:hypothetical protein
MQTHECDLKGYIRVEHLIAWLTCIAFTFPLFNQSLGLLVEQLFTMTLFGVSLFVIAQSQMTVSRSNLSVFIIVFVFLVLTLLSLLISGNDVITRDVIELAKPVYLGSFFLLSYLCKWRYNDFQRYIKFVLITFIFIGIWGILEANTSLVNSISGIIYKETRSSLQFKAIGAFIAPYVFGSLMLMPAWYFLLAVLFQPRKVLNFLGFTICFLALVFTQSRTIILSFAATIIYFLIFAIVTKWLPKRRVVLLITYILIATFITTLVAFYDEIKLALGYMVRGLEVVVISLQNGGFDALIERQKSVGLRFAQLMFAVENQMLVPLIGVGIGKALFMPESFYALYLYRYGLTGIIIHVALVVFVWYRSIKLAKVLRSDSAKPEFAFLIATSIYMVSLPISYLSSSINDFTRTGFFFYVLAGLVFVLYRRIIRGLA